VKDVPDLDRAVHGAGEQLALRAHCQRHHGVFVARDWLEHLHRLHVPYFNAWEKKKKI
jgi:hypothetical protein